MVRPLRNRGGPFFPSNGGIHTRGSKAPVTLTVPDFSKLRVLVAGDAMLDEYWFGDTVRISPEAPVPVVRTRSAEQRPGGAANVALNVAALGASSVLAAIVGEDERGRLLTQALEPRGVRCEFVRSRTLPTIQKLRVLARSQQLLRIDAEQSLEACAGELGASFARSPRAGWPKRRGAGAYPRCG